MYHVVRSAAGGPLGRLKGLDLPAFREQLAYIRAHYTPVGLFDLVAAADGRTAFRRGRSCCRSTMGMPDITRWCSRFWPMPACPPPFFRSHRRSSTARSSTSTRSSASWPQATRSNGSWRPSRPPSSVSIRAAATCRVPQAVVEAFEVGSGGGRLCEASAAARAAPGVRQPLVDELFRTLVSADEAGFAAELYMDGRRGERAHRAGMTIGAHGDRHLRLSTPVARRTGGRDRRCAAGARRGRIAATQLRVLLRERRPQRGEPRTAARPRVQHRPHHAARSGANRRRRIAHASADRHQRSSGAVRGRAERMDASRFRSIIDRCDLRSSGTRACSSRPVPNAFWSNPWLSGSCYWRSWWHFPPNTPVRPGVPRAGLRVAVPPSFRPFPLSVAASHLEECSGVHPEVRRRRHAARARRHRLQARDGAAARRRRSPCRAGHASPRISTVRTTAPWSSNAMESCWRISTTARSRAPPCGRCSRPSARRRSSSRAIRSRRPTRTVTTSPIRPTPS